MKIIFFIVGVFLVSSVSALDTSYSTGGDYSIKNDKSISIKKGKSSSISIKKSDSNSHAKSASRELTFDTYAVYLPLASKCVQEQKTAVNFDLTTIVDNDSVNLNLQEWYDNIAKNNAPIKKADMDEEKFKKYLGCLAFNGAEMAQANILINKEVNQERVSLVELQQMAKRAFKVSSKIVDPNIKSQLKMVAKSLNEPCVFLGSTDKIKCGSLSYTFSQNTLQIGNETIYGYSNTFGITTQLRVSVNDSDTHSNDVSSDNTTTRNKDMSMTQDQSDSQNRNTKQDVAVGKYIPALQ